MLSVTDAVAQRDLSATDAHVYKDWVQQSATVIVPVGALEQHGPHMPLGTDALLATAVARGVAETIDSLKGGSKSYPVRIAQTFNYGYKSQQKSGGGNHLPGTISLDAATLSGMTRDITRSFLEQGVRHIIFLNGHYENYQFLYEGVDLALRDLGIKQNAKQTVLLLSYWDYVNEKTLNFVYPDGFPGWDIEHGGVLETSLMLHLYPELTDMSRAVSHPPAVLTKFDRLPVVPERTPHTGCLSCPDGSSAEKGKKMFEQLIRAIGEDLCEELAL